MRRFALLAALLIPLASSPALADPAVGSACSPNGQITRSGGAETSGVGAQMVCAGGVWVSTFGYDGSGNASISNAVSVTGNISPTSLSADQNDYNPAGLATSTLLRVTSSTAVNITGLAGGSNGRVLTVFNIGSNNIVLKNQNTSSTAANRFAINADITLGADQSATIIYDSTSQRWRSASIPFSSGGGGGTPCTDDTTSTCLLDATRTNSDPQFLAASIKSGVNVLGVTGTYSGCFEGAIPHESNRNWFGVASSSDGVNLVAVVNGGRPYTSTDSGTTWTQRDSANRGWVSVASSSDGTKLVGVVYGGRPYTSTNSGATWTQRDSANRNWTDVASSSDGTKLVGVVDGGRPYTSTDSGATWTQRDSANRGWTSVTSSSDGTKLAASVYGGQIYTSTDSGVTWTLQAASPGDAWSAIESSGDGTKLIVAAGNQETSAVYLSTNSGVTWTPAAFMFGIWASAAISTDGTTLAIGGVAGPAWVSTDGGTTWNAHGKSFTHMGVALSSDGKKMVMVGGDVEGGWDEKIYTMGCQ